MDVCLRLRRRKALSECATRLLDEFSQAALQSPAPRTLVEKLKNELYTTQAEVITADLLYERGEQQSMAQAQGLYHSVLAKREKFTEEVTSSSSSSAASSLTQGQQSGEEEEQQMEAIVAFYAQQMVVSLHSKLGRLCYEKGDYDGAEGHFQMVLGLKESLAAFEAAERKRAAAAAAAVAAAADEGGKPDAAEADAEVEELDDGRYSALLIENSQATLLRAETSLATLASAKGDVEQAERLLRSVIAAQYEALRRQQLGGGGGGGGDSGAAAAAAAAVVVGASSLNKDGTVDENSLGARDLIDSRSSLVSVLRTRLERGVTVQVASSSSSSSSSQQDTAEVDAEAEEARLLEEIEELQSMIVSWRLKHLGPSHPASLDAQASLAIIQDSGGKAQGEVLLKRVLSQQKELLGASNMDTLGTHNSLATLYAQRHDHDSARAEYEALIPQLEAAHGERHPNTIQTRRSFATVLANSGQHDAAIELLEGVVEAQREVLGPEHPELGRSQQMLERFVAVGSYQAEARGMFSEIDKDGSGTISMAELSCRLADFGLTDESIEAIAMKLMTMMDADGDGEIDLLEWCRGYPAWRQLQDQIEAQ